jgi:hypothetical protein
VLERPVHTFMAAVLLGLARLDALGHDAQAYPPDGEAGEVADARLNNSPLILIKNRHFATPKPE